MSAGNAICNVRSIRVVEGEVTASTVNGERLGLMFAGVTYYEAYGFSGNSSLLCQFFSVSMISLRRLIKSFVNSVHKRCSNYF